MTKIIRLNFLHDDVSKEVEQSGGDNKKKQKFIDIEYFTEIEYAAMRAIIQNVIDRGFDKNFTFLGKGGFGATYKTTLFGYPFAVKKVSKESSSLKEAFEKAKRVRSSPPFNYNDQFVPVTLNAPKSLISELDYAPIFNRCPYLNKTYAYGFYDQDLYVIMELANGGDLSGYIKKCTERPRNKKELAYNRYYKFTQMSERTIARLISEIAQGLECLAVNGLSHLDLKPDNVFLYKDPKTEMVYVRLGDYGLTEIVCEMGNGWAGTPGYMAPEIIAEAGDYYEHKDDELCILMHNPHGKNTVEADMWALGITLIACIMNDMFSVYQVLTGEPDLLNLGYGKMLVKRVNFFEQNKVTIIQEIAKSQIYSPAFTKLFCDLINGLIVIDPNHRWKPAAVIDYCKSVLNA